MSRGSQVDVETLARGQAQLEAELEKLDEALQSRVRELAQRLESDVTGPLRQAAGAARDAHARLMSEAGLGAEAAVPQDDWPTLRAYRAGVLHQVVSPLLAALEELRPGTAVGSRWSDFLSGIEEAAGRMPEEIRREEPADLFGTGPEDGIGTRTLRGALRTGRALTGLFRRGRIREQRIPLRDLARESLRSTGLPAVVDHHESLQQHHARPVALLENAVAMWVREWFPAEAPGHSAEAHLPGDSLEALAAIRRRLQPVVEEMEGQESPETATGTAGESETPDGDGDEGDVEEGDDPRPESAVVATSLHSALEEASALASPDDVLAEVEAATAALAIRLREAAEVADTPLARDRSRGERKRLQRLGERLSTRYERWSRWHEDARSRLVFTADLLTFREEVDRLLAELIAGTLEASLLRLDRELGEARDGLHELRARVESPEYPLQAETERAALAKAVDAILEEAREILKEQVTEPIVRADLRSDLYRVADEMVEELADLLRGLPETSRVHATREAVDGVDPTQPLRTIPFREVAHQALDVLHLESLRSSSTPLLDFMDLASEECDRVPEVVAYNLTAARDELLEDEGDGSDGDDGDEDPASEGQPERPSGPALLEDARSLTLQGLDRSAQALDAVLARALPPWDRFASRAHDILLPAFEQIHQRMVMERAVQEQIRDVRSLLEGWFRRARGQAGSAWSSGRRWAERFLKRAYVQGARLVRRGRSALGAGEVHEGEAERALEVLRNIPALLEPLPLVYRRLYSFQPVTDASLLVGRDDETLWVTRRYAAWKDGLHTPNVLTGPVTVGFTSLFNVLATTVFREATVVRLSLLDRYTSGDALARRIMGAIARARGKELSEEPWTLERATRVLLEAGDEGDDGPPLVVLTEHLPHTLLRAPGGTALAEAFLSMQARTASRVFWLSAVSDPAWKLLSKAELRATGLVTTGTLSQPDRATLERVIMVRHQRSGVPVEFLPPDDPNPLLRRKLQRTRDEEERQSLLRTEFFDRLHRASQGNVLMAILLWLKSADFSSREGWLRLRPPRTIRFAFMEELDVGLDFALMAFLEHGSLTLEEYARVFAASPEESFQALESLRSRMLLDRLDTQGGLPVPIRILEPETRYRIPPLLTQVVSQYLRNHNILH